MRVDARWQRSQDPARRKERCMTRYTVDLGHCTVVEMSDKEALYRDLPEAFCSLAAREAESAATSGDSKDVRRLRTEEMMERAKSILAELDSAGQGGAAPDGPKAQV